jgi:hypothetical protein
MGLTFVFDGITVDCARELLTDDHSAPHQIGNRCCYSYLTSLADFTVGLLSCSKLATTGTTPGQWVKDNFEKKFEAVETKSDLKPKDLLVEGSPYWQEIQEDIRLLDKLSEGQYRLWQEHMIREIDNLLLGPNSNIREDLANPADYIFKVEFTSHPKLQALVPESYLTKIYTAVFPESGGNAEAKAAHPKAIREFFTRNVVAHILIFCWYRYVSTCGFLLSKCLRWPHCTRASLIEVGASEKWSLPKTEKGVPEPHSIWMLRTIVMPNVLTPILQKARGEHEPGRVVRNELQDLVACDRYKTERELVEEVVSLLGRGKDRAARDKMAQFVVKCNQERTPAKFSIGYADIFKTEFETGSKKMGHVLKQGGWNWQDYEKACAEVFPYLFQ